MTLKIAIIGRDVGAYSIAAFLKHRMPASKILMISGKIDQHAFSSPWIRNDKKGRTAVMQLGRDILQMGESEFVVSKVNSTMGLITSSNRIEKIPSFRSVVSNLAAIALEPFRRSQTFHSDISVRLFLANRFGSKFSDKYAETIARCLTGQPAESVSVHSAFPRMASSFSNHKSVLLGPFWAMFNPQKSESRQFTNVMDHLWQAMITGGKFVSMSPRLDLSVFLERLETHVKEISTIFSEKEPLKIDETGILFSDGTTEKPDLIISSEPPATLAKLLGDDPTIPAVKILNSGKIMYRSRFEWSFSDKKIPSIWVNQDSGEMILLQSSLFDNNAGGHKGLIMDVLSENKYLEFDKFAFSNKDWLVRVGLGPILSKPPVKTQSFSEEIPANLIGTNNALVELNKMRKKSKIEVQLVGKWYYCTSGSVTDIIADAESLANILARRFSRFPKIENELTSDYMSRGDRSLDMSYQTDARHSTLLTQ